MKLSIVTITISKEKRLPTFLAPLKLIADELVVFVDDATTSCLLPINTVSEEGRYLLPINFLFFQLNPPPAII